MKKPHLLRRCRRAHVLAFAGCCAILAVTFSSAKEAAPRKSSAKPKVTTSQKKTVEEKPSRPIPSPAEAEKKGFDYLLSQQHEDGGWGQGGGWRQNLEKQGSRVEGENVVDPPDLGNTCIALMALHRAGHSPSQGDLQKAATRGFEFLCTQVEQSDDASLYVTSVRDTQLQTKIGPYVDTFLAAWVLSEMKDDVPDDLEKRRSAALDKTVKKIEKHQKQDGTFAGNHGWASVLSQGICSKALNSASINGAMIAQATLERDQAHNVSGLDLNSGTFSRTGAGSLTISALTDVTATAGGVAAVSGSSAAAAAPATGAPSDAGVSLYAGSSKLGGLVAKSQSNEALKAQSTAIIADASSTAEQLEGAKANLKKIESDEEAKIAALRGISSKLGDARFVAGFGNNGGEEFLSYMNISEAMREKGGKDWENWNDKMTTTLCSAQNDDGSWAGHHCITGRTFCTSAALLTLLVEKMKVEEPVLSQKREDESGKEPKEDKKAEPDVVPVKAETSP